MEDYVPMSFSFKMDVQWSFIAGYIYILFFVVWWVFFFLGGGQFDQLFFL